MNTENLIEILTGKPEDKISKESIEEKLFIVNAKTKMVMDAITYTEDFSAELDLNKKQNDVFIKFIDTLHDLLIDFAVQKDLLHNDFRQYKKGL